MRDADWTTEAVPESVDTLECTAFTQGMIDRIGPLAKSQGLPVWQRGAEVRVLAAEERLYCFLGQPLAVRGKGQGTSLERWAVWRRLVPFTFVAVQGDVGWMVTFPDDHFTPDLVISRAQGAERVGVRLDEMLRVAFTPGALERHPGYTPFRWGLTHEWSAARRALGDSLF